MDSIQQMQERNGGGGSEFMQSVEVRLEEIKSFEMINKGIENWIFTETGIWLIKQGLSEINLLTL